MAWSPVPVRRVLLGAGLALAASVPAAVPGPDLRIEPLAPGVYRHVTTLDAAGTRMPTNGLLVVGAGRSLLVDTGWNPDQARRLLALARERLGAPVAVALVTHSHQDRAGGLAAVRAEGIPTWAHPETIRRLGPAGAWLRPVGEGLVLGGEGGRVEVFFPGPGHSPDNLVAWLPESRILYGGCFLKGPGATDLGNLADAAPRLWVGSLARLRARYPGPALVVPGHGEPGGPELVGLTRRLLAAFPPELRPGPPR